MTVLAGDEQNAGDLAETAATTGVRQQVGAARVHDRERGFEEEKEGLTAVLMDMVGRPEVDGEDDAVLGVHGGAGAVPAIFWRCSMYLSRKRMQRGRLVLVDLLEELQVDEVESWPWLGFGAAMAMALPARGRRWFGGSRSDLGRVWLRMMEEKVVQRWGLVSCR